MSKDFIILKLGGSLITDKRKVEFVRKENLEMLSQQIAQALDEDECLKGEN
jgi:isopentenyl phosphate kinase